MMSKMKSFMQGFGSVLNPFNIHKTSKELSRKGRELDVELDRIFNKYAEIVKEQDKEILELKSELLNCYGLLHGPKHDEEWPTEADLEAWGNRLAELEYQLEDT